MRDFFLGGLLSHQHFARVRRAIYLSFLSASVAGYSYVVQKNDTLSTIAFLQLGRPVYGERGSLAHILELNPEIKNRDLIFIGQTLKLVPIIKAAQAEIKACLPDRQIASDAPPRQSVAAHEPIVAATPAEPAPVQSSAETFEAHTSWEVTPEFSATTISSTDSITKASATLISRSNLAVTAKYRQILSEKNSTGLFLQFRQISMKPPATFNLQNESQSLFSFGARADHRSTPTTNWGASVGLVQRSYLKGVTASTIAIDSPYVPETSLDWKYGFYNQKPFTYSVTALAGVDLPTAGDGYTTRLNPLGSLALSVEKISKEGLQTEAGLRGTYISEETSIASQNQTDLSVFITFKF